MAKTASTEHVSSYSSPSHTININIHSSPGKQSHTQLLSLSKVFTLIGEQIDPAIRGGVVKVIDGHPTRGHHRINSGVETAPNDLITFDKSGPQLPFTPPVYDPTGVTTSGARKADHETSHIHPSTLPHQSLNQIGRQKATRDSSCFSTPTGPEENTHPTPHLELLSSTTHQILRQIMETMHSLMQRLDVLERTVAGLNEMRNSSISTKQKPPPSNKAPIIDQPWKVAEQKQPTSNVDVVKSNGNVRAVNHAQSKSKGLSAASDTRKKGDACCQDGKTVVDLKVEQLPYPFLGKPEIPLPGNPRSRITSAQNIHNINQAIEMIPPTVITGQEKTDVASKACEKLYEAESLLKEHEMAHDKSRHSIDDSIEKIHSGISGKFTTSNEPVCLEKTEKTPRGSDRGVSLGDSLLEPGLDEKAKSPTSENSGASLVSGTGSKDEKISIVDNKHSRDSEMVQENQCPKQDSTAENDVSSSRDASAKATPSSDRKKTSESCAASAGYQSPDQKQAADKNLTQGRFESQATSSTAAINKCQSETKSTSADHSSGHCNSTIVGRVHEDSLPKAKSKTLESGKPKVNIGSSASEKDNKPTHSRSCTPESKSSNDNVVAAKRVRSDDSPPQPVYESEASRCAAGLRSNKPLPEPDWYPPKVHTLGPNAPYYICHRFPFSREFIEFNFGGFQWSPGFYWVPDSGLLPSRSYWLIDREWEPFMPCDPGQHGAKLSLFTNDIKGPDPSCYQNVPVFVKKKGGEGYVYIGQHSLLPEHETVDLDTLKERVPQPVLKYWAKQLAARDRPTWVKEKLYEHFLPSFTSASDDSQPHMSDADARKKIAKLRSKDFLEAFSRPDGDLFALRFKWEYLQCIRFDEGFYKFLFKIKHEPKLQRSAASTAIRRSSRTSSSTPGSMEEGPKTTPKKILRVTSKSSGIPPATKPDEPSTTNAQSPADSTKASGSSSSTSLSKEATLRKDSATGNNNETSNGSSTPPAADTAPTDGAAPPDTAMSSSAILDHLKDSRKSPESIVPKMVPPHLRHAQSASESAATPDSISPATDCSNVHDFPEQVSHPLTSTEQAGTNIAEPVQKVAVSCLPPHLRHKRCDSLQDDTNNEDEMKSRKSTAVLPPHLRPMPNTPAKSSKPGTAEKAPAKNDQASAASQTQLEGLFASKHAPMKSRASVFPEKTARPPSNSLSEQLEATPPLKQDEPASSSEQLGANTVIPSNEARPFVPSPESSPNDKQASSAQQKGVVAVPPHLRYSSTGNLQPVTPSAVESAAPPADPKQSKTALPPHLKSSQTAIAEPEGEDKVHPCPESVPADVESPANSTQKSPRKSSSPRRAKCATAEELWRKLTHAKAHQEKKRRQISW